MGTFPEALAPRFPTTAGVRVEGHRVVGFDPWRTRVACSCGVIALADAAEAAWVGQDGHRLAFGTILDLEEDGPPGPVMKGELPEEPHREARNRRHDEIVREVLDAEGVDRETAPEPTLEPSGPSRPSYASAANPRTVAADSEPRPSDPALAAALTRAQAQEDRQRKAKHTGNQKVREFMVEKEIHTTKKRSQFPSRSPKARRAERLRARQRARGEPTAAQARMFERARIRLEKLRPS